MSDKIKIMVVDDSNMIIKMIQGFLQSYQIEIVGVANDGQTAVELFKKTDPDIVTLDITMPKMDGLTVLQEMLKIKDTTKVIIISALTDNATALKALQIGAKDFIPKPFKEDSFKEVLNRILSEN
ncbi:MAG: response regulator [Calditrichaceae bacterium]|nr:response regulator [Calditrichaceae bacterium]MBN2707836.1 response regulator [Calditrichaceae bacterium]